MIIKNRDELSGTELREQVLDMIETGIESVHPYTIMNRAVTFNPDERILSINDKTYDVSMGRIFVIGGGKASAVMAEALETILGGENITDGVVNCNYKHRDLNRIKIIEASHPIPDERGVAGVEAMFALKDSYSISKNDIVICLISGGGSALMPYPVEEIGLEEKQAITELLIKRGPSIQEINAVRKHLSQVKGGQLGRYFAPARVVSLILSDVVGNDLDAIASGPTVPDSSTFRDAYHVLEKYNLLSDASKNILDFLEKGIAGKVEETPKELTNCHNHIIGENRMALDAMASKAEAMGLKPLILTSEQKGDPTGQARLRANEIIESKYKNHDVLLIGGETTPRLPENHGQGGRNQHFAAVTLDALKAFPGEWCMVSVGTDGSDYLEGIAGAVVDNESSNNLKTKKINIQAYIDSYDSHTMFDRLGHSLIMTDKTGTNVYDIMVYLLKKGMR